MTRWKREYSDVAARIGALCEGEPDIISKMATMASELFHEFEAFHWVGFYRLVSPELLKIGPYQGGHGCLNIPISKGVCGACARTGIIQRIDDVNAIADHIACAASTQSEIVLPVMVNGTLIGVLDIDSDNLAEFDAHDAEALGKILETSF